MIKINFFCDDEKRVKVKGIMKRPKKELKKQRGCEKKGKDKGTTPYASSFGYFFGSIVKSNRRINRGKRTLA